MTYCVFNFASVCFAGEDASIALLKQLVEINSGTAQVDAVNQVQYILAERLKSLGFTVALKPNPLGKDKSGSLLVATMAGEKSNYVTLILLSDTVFDTSAGFKGLTMSSDGKTAKGPGVIDAEGGAVVVLAGLDLFLKEHARLLYSLRVVVSPSEETGSDGFHEEFKKLSENTHVALGFEPALDEHTIIDSRRGNRWYHIKVSGSRSTCWARPQRRYQCLLGFITETLFNI